MCSYWFVCMSCSFGSEAGKRRSQDTNVDLLFVKMLMRLHELPVKCFRLPLHAFPTMIFSGIMLSLFTLIHLLPKIFEVTNFLDLT